MATPPPQPPFLRTLLFVPGSRPERFDKALLAGADAIVIDLEDAVAPAEKYAARAAAHDWLIGSRPAIIRINAADTPWFYDDLSVVALPNVIAVMLPKTESLCQIDAVIDSGACSLIPLLESARGMAAASAIASHSRVLRLAFGSLDLQADLGMQDVDEEELLYFRSQLVLASRLAGLRGPIDGVTVAINDEERLSADVARARRLGFSGKLCIHPCQVGPVQRGFLPSPTTLAWAQRVVAACAAAGGAVVTIDGRMVDRPVLLRAEAVLHEANLKC